MPPSTLDELSFTSKGKVPFGTFACANWLAASLHKTGTAVYVLTLQAIDVALSADPKINLLEPFVSGDSDVEAICIRKTTYLPETFMGILLKRNLTPVEAWIFLSGAIVDNGAMVDFRPITNWIRVAITRKSETYQLSPLAMPRPTSPLADRYLTCYRQKVLTSHLPGIDPALQRMQG